MTDKRIDEIRKRPDPVRDALQYGATYSDAGAAYNVMEMYGRLVYSYLKCVAAMRKLRASDFGERKSPMWDEIKDALATVPEEFRNG